MATIREQTQQFERETLSPRAARSADSRGRARPERDCDIRTPYQRDRDRILHSKAFRRLKGKTQVFLSPEGDHYRTRLTHTLEVAQISRTVARALRLNEDLVEAIALGHDLGHTPFGHAGEAVLARMNPGGFHHARQGLRVVEKLEWDGKGLNLTAEVRDGIRGHSKGVGSLAEARLHNPLSTLEAEVVRICDSVAYANHDLDDALRSGLVRPEAIPAPVNDALGPNFAVRINTLVHDIVHSSADGPGIAMSGYVEEALETLRLFLVERVYRSGPLEELFGKAARMLEALYSFYVARPEETGLEGAGDDSPQGQACDFIAGMTDQYAIAQAHKHLMPRRWMDED